MRPLAGMLRRKRKCGNERGKKAKKRQWLRFLEIVNCGEHDLGSSDSKSTRQPSLSRQSEQMASQHNETMGSFGMMALILRGTPQLVLS